MLLAFQILLFVFLVIFFFGAIGEKDKDRALNYACILIASVITQAFLFWLG